MSRFIALLTGTAAIAASVALSAAPAMAKSGPITEVTKHGIYKAVVTCPRWNGPSGGPAPILAAPHPPAKFADPKPGHVAPRPVYAPLVTCTVTFLKDGPGVTPMRKAIFKSCAMPGHRAMPGCCSMYRHGHHRPHTGMRWTMPFLPSCVVLETGFGGMARQVSHHTLAASRTHRW
jgi:hypothetical protein